MSDESRPADAASAGRFDNPVAEADGGGEEEAAAGSEPAPSAAEAPFFCKVVRVQLRLLGGNSLFQWRVVHGLLLLQVVCVTLYAWGAPKYKGNSQDPQRPYLAPM